MEPGMTHKQYQRILHAALDDVRAHLARYRDMRAPERAALYVVNLSGRLAAQGRLGDAEARELAQAITIEILDIDTVQATPAMDDENEGQTA